MVTRWQKTKVQFGRSIVLKRWVPAPAAEYAKNLVKAAKLARPPTKRDPVLPRVRLPKELDVDDEDLVSKLEKLEDIASGEGELLLELALGRGGAAGGGGSGGGGVVGIGGGSGGSGGSSVITSGGDADGPSGTATAS